MQTTAKGLPWFMMSEIGAMYLRVKHILWQNDWPVLQ